jgi:hypothetical protein
MKQLFLCHLITSLCYKSDLSVRLSCIFYVSFVICFGEQSDV